jgi:hypothetical protein
MALGDHNLKKNMSNKKKHQKINKSLILFVVFGSVSGCFRSFRPTNESIHSRTWMKSVKQPSPKPLYCYKNLTDILCYKYPIPGQEHRLIGQPIPPESQKPLCKPCPFWEKVKKEPC